ncbi:helix-turn-helix transcriptional regulator [Lysinibacillus xylanilyticus]|uniref:helix-turn-helix transcriptional regulator n=1 Tax=Lysinibacillus xylanilyticus TaxID=582475 RepID=UPI0037F348C5
MKLLTQDKLDAMITDYHWMVNAIKEMRSEMVTGAKTAQYGIEATLPKAVGGVGDPIMQEAIRRSKNIKRVAEYERKLLEVQKLLDKVTGDRELQVLNWMLDGKSKRWIGQNMGLSHTHIQNIKDSIVKQMVN